MNIAVRYHSRGGNTKKVGEAIAEAVKATAKDCSSPVLEPVDLLFLGGSVYAFGLDEVTKKFISALNPDHVKAAALFGTSAMVKTGNQEMAELLKKKGIPVLEQDFYCRGSFTVMHRGHPNDADLKRAADFAVSSVKELEGQ